MVIKYYEAYIKNGYFANTQGTVSDANEDGVVLAIIRSEVKSNKNRDNPLYFDSRLIVDWEANRQGLPGNQWRKAHIKRALDEFDGKVDVILWDGIEAEFWKRSGSWKITFFDEHSGHHRVDLFAAVSR